MNTALLEAKLAPATLETREKGKAVLVRTSMIDYINGICNDDYCGVCRRPESGYHR